MVDSVFVAMMPAAPADRHVSTITASATPSTSGANLTNTGFDPEAARTTVKSRVRSAAFCRLRRSVVFGELMLIVTKSAMDALRVKKEVQS